MSILPGATLGLLGGGQLGRMFTAAAQRMGYRVTVLDPDGDSPSSGIAERHLHAGYLDAAALRELASTCAGVTTEFENVPAETLRTLAKLGMTVSPEAGSVAIAQDRILEKGFITDNGFGSVPHASIRDAGDLERVARTHPELFPGLLKVSRLGYDGRGQAPVGDMAALECAFDHFGHVPCVLEQRLSLQTEISVIVARGFDGSVATFPVSENRHRDGILDVSIVPAGVAPAIARQARDTAIGIAERLDYRGVLCVEFFVLAGDGSGGRLLVNEIAPRPHNSGHYTLDACVTSQFEQQLRVLCGLPLGGTAMCGAAVMVNLLGDLWRQGEPDWKGLLRHPGVKLHLYGKRVARPGRKMGHYTVLAETAAAALSLALEIKRELDTHPGLEPHGLDAV
ncbi:5-(carboxyamino)imidazole ribonucleotide synthase [Nitrosovibrio sp. Nv17]|uniref:5-(carboxyamino)imidazole ribonucleotide synthase n=1 Tax=Nitrosovibrio sp. Nv17 TaxID=1855339 RepID=UPI000908D668|nr:5-(carboxyamino)imidazole ribonucleotide synthase [Nitrosovibrio sp. Nv17]SFW19417.1 5-(carboxyamino)imidazole ribonucleotide synthase [Nitrosovibrio sp. Nv17]